jgi:hypothetical protein
MKENTDRVYVHPKFKHLLRMEAASKGKDIVDFTKELAEQQPSEISKLTEEWKSKWQSKTKKTHSFDFP